MSKSSGENSGGSEASKSSGENSGGSEASKSKKYYWLKLKNDFFRQKEIKKLRTIAGGDTYTIIYLKLLLLSLEREGVLVYEGVEKDFAHELALEMDELVNNITVTLNYLFEQGLLEEKGEDEYLLLAAKTCMGKITQEGVRKKNYRDRQKLMGQCPTLVPSSPPIVPPELELELELELEPELETETETETETENTTTPSAPSKGGTSDSEKKNQTISEAPVTFDEILQNNPDNPIVEKIRTRRTAS